MYLRSDADSHNAIPILPDLDFVHFIFGFFPSLDILLGPVNMASSICDLEAKISIIKRHCRCGNIPCSA